MAISVLTRPEKTLSNGFLSKWNSSELPLRYKLDSDLFPINKVDSSESITSVTYNSSKRGTVITLSSPASTVIELDFVTVSGTGIEDLDGGNFQITEISGNDIVLDVKIDQSSNTGSILKYYRNYLGLVKVFAGARDGHPYNTDNSKPLEEIGIIEVNFTDDGVDNTGYANVKSFIKPDVNADFDYNEENRHKGWTSFHIQIAESYDVVNGDSITSFTSTFTDDQNDSCVPFSQYDDSGFTSGLALWSQDTGNIASLDQWVGGSGNVTCSVTQRGSYILYQDVQIQPNIEYSISLDFTLSNTDSNGFQWQVFGKKDGVWDTNGLTVSESFATNGTYTTTLNFTPNDSYDSVGVFAVTPVSTGSFDIQLDSMQINTQVSDVCLSFNYAVYGCKQFQDDLGGNFGDYVLNINDTITPKILTHFEELSYFYDKPFYINGIIPQSTFSYSVDGDNLFIRVEIFDDQNNNLLTYNYQVTSKGDGVYTIDPNIKNELDNNNINECDWSYANIQFIITPDNTFVDGDRGTFEDGTVNGFTVLNSTPNEVGQSISSSSIGRTGNFSAGITSSKNSMNESSKIYKVLENDTSIDVIEGLQYEIKAYISVRVFNYEPQQLNNAYFYFMPKGYDKTNTSTSPYKLNIDSTYLTVPSFDDWYETTTTFTANSTTSIQLELIHELKNNIDVSTGVNLSVDDITFKGPVDFISESKQINNKCSCSPYGVTLRWLNDLGGFESWHFDGKAVYSENVTQKVNIKRDITSNWDSTFISGDTQNDNIKTTSNKSILVRSQLLTKNEQEVIQQIRRSAKVQLLMDSGKWQTVTINQGKFVINEEGDKTREISFEISLPETLTQEQ